METAYYILNQYFSAVHWLFLFAVFTVTLTVTVIAAKRRKMGRTEGKQYVRAILTSLLITYIVFILLVTLIARTPAEAQKIKLIPFWSWYEVIVHHDKGLFCEIVLNVLFFMPAGALFRMLNLPLRRCARFAFLLSLGIELTQYFTCLGLCEPIDDVFGNTGGAVLAWIACNRIERVWSSGKKET